MKRMRLVASRLRSAILLLAAFTIAGSVTARAEVCVWVYT
jgi:hypothetical protein